MTAIAAALLGLLTWLSSGLDHGHFSFPFGNIGLPVATASATADQYEYRRRLQDEPAEKQSGVTQQSPPHYSRINVFTPYRDSAISRKLRNDLASMSGTLVTVVVNTTKEQQQFLQSTDCQLDGAAERFQEFVNAEKLPLAQELWKYCALLAHGGFYLDAETPILAAKALYNLLVGGNIGATDTDTGTDTDAPNRSSKKKETTQFAAVLMDAFAPKSIHGSLLLIRQPKSTVAQQMARFLVDTPINMLDASPLLIPRTLHDLILANSNKPTTLEPGPPSNNGDWYFLQQACTVNPFHHTSSQSTTKSAQQRWMYQCPPQSGFCCSIFMEQDVMLASRHPVSPLPSISQATLPKPYHYAQASSDQVNSGLSVEKSEQLPFVATVRERTIVASDNRANAERVPTFYEQLSKENCLPGNSCSKCLSDKKKGATCDTCRDACPCYCKALCRKDDKGKQQAVVASELVVTPPRYARDPTRYVPRIVHQTWFEELSKEKYPNMSRLMESFRTSGWEYRFYTDEQASVFLQEHFPPEVRHAYETLIPGAFKADLFRYCVLLIHGGVYADVDTMMGPSLNDAIRSDVGFMVGLDEPGKKIGTRMCLWNGFIAAAPGHPFLAKVIETVVNNVQRRYTSVDIARDHCPDGPDMPLPEMSIIHSFSPLFVAGPCMLGSSINNVLGRDGQTQFEAGELKYSPGGKEASLNHGASFVKGLDEDPHKRIPGRTIILDQDKWDMGAHRFTLLEQNLIVLSTDFPDSDDREKLDDYKHYSETRVKFTIYGLDGVYRDDVRANGLLRVAVNATSNAMQCHFNYVIDAIPNV